MELREVFNSRTIAYNRTVEQSDRIPFMGEAFFPPRKKMGLDLKWLKSHKGLGIALKPSTFDALPTVRTRGQLEFTKSEMPFFRESMLVKENDLMELSRIQDTDDPYLQPVLDSLYNDANELIDGADISAEKMRMQLLAPKDGKMNITIGAADNTIYTYEYDSDETWKNSHYELLSGGSAWDKDTATPLTDIQKAVQKLASIGVTATRIIGNSTTFDYLLANKQIQNALISITGQAITFVDSATVEEVLRRKLKLEWISYDKMYKDYDGKETKFYPDDYITILGNTALGNTWYGTTPEELTAIGFMNLPQPPVDITVLPSGVAIAVKSEYKPAFAVTTVASQIVLPSYEGMDSVYVIKVK